MRPILAHESYLLIERDEGALIVDSRWGTPTTGLGGDPRNTSRFDQMRYQVGGDMTGWDLSLEGSITGGDFVNLSTVAGLSVPANITSAGVWDIGPWLWLRLVTNTVGTMVETTPASGVLDLPSFVNRIGGFEVVW